MDKTIFQINDDFAKLFTELEENGGELTEELEKQLQETSEQMTNKVRNCCAFIQSMKNDIAAIKVEKDRLNALQKSKESAIAAITNLVLWAIHEHGTADKKGKKWIDWGTGKVSARISHAVNVNAYAIESMAKAIKHVFAFGAYTNTLDNHDAIDSDGIIDSLENLENAETGLPDPVSVTSEDFTDVYGTITLNVPLADIMSGEGYKTVAKIARLSTNWDIKPYVDKTAIKAKLAETENKSNVCELVDNESLNVR